MDFGCDRLEPFAEKKGNRAYLLGTEVPSLLLSRSGWPGASQAVLNNGMS